MNRAIRNLASRPGFTGVTIAILALGFGVNAAMFSLTRTVLLRPLPYHDADRLIQVGEASPTRGVSYSPTVPANYLAWRERVSAFETTAAWRVVYFALAGPIAPTRVQGVRIEPSFFSLLDIVPALGRNFTARDARPGDDRVVLLSAGFWHRHFGGNPRVIGGTLTVDGEPCTIVGVLPDTFRFFRVINRELDVWRPFAVEPTDHEHSVTVYAKLKPTASVDAARAELSTVYASLPAEPFRDGWTSELWPLATRFTLAQRPILTALQAAVALVLCIAAANVANLVLAVAAGRRKDVAVRVALGATPWQLTAELGRETLLLAAAGAFAGLLLAIWIVDLLNRSVSYQDINRLEPFRVDAWVAVFTVGLALASAIVFALLPARRTADPDVIDALKDSSHGATTGATHRRLRAALVIAELALSIVLLTSALELTRGALSLNGMNRGVDAEHVMTAQLSLSGPQYADAGRLTQFADAVLAQLTTAAGIEAASIVNYPPLSIIGTSFPIAIGGRAEAPGKEPRALCWIVAPRYFGTVGIPILAGRDFTPADTNDRLGVAIVSRRLAERFWGGTDVIGQHLTPLFPPSDAFWIPLAIRRPLTIVGVVGDVREDGIADSGAGDPQLYLPYGQNPTRILTVVVRSRGAPSSAASLIRDAVRATDRDQPTFDERTLDDVRRETFARPRELAWLIGAFAALALLLSAIGVYGVMAYLTTARAREIGIRIALGATRKDVVGLVVGNAMKMAGIGVAAGVLVTPLALSTVNASIYGIGPSTPGVLVAVAALLGAVSACAAAFPAYRAARDGEGVALRST
jgi:putative ABC transport system permease protein